MKKIVSFLAAAALAAGMLTGCGQTGESDWKYVQDKGTLKIGITLFDPMNYYDPQDPQKLIGFDTELAEAVCAKLGVTPEFVEIDWDQKTVELQSKSIDCIWNGMTILDDLKESLDFSVPYSGNMQVCVINKANASVYTTLESMATARFVAEAESAGDKSVEGSEALKGAQLTAVQAQRDTLLELKSGTADVAVIDAVMAYASVGEGTSYSDLMVVEGIELSKEEYGIGFRKGSDITAKVNDALQQLANDGTVAALAEKYPSVLPLLEAKG